MKNQTTKAPDVLAFAAEQLDSYWCRICGDGSHAQVTLRVDPAACPSVEDPALDDAYAVEIQQGIGFIAGSNPRSVLLGVYAFLQAVGCRFIRPGPDGEIHLYQEVYGHGGHPPHPRRHPAGAGPR